MKSIMLFVLFSLSMSGAAFADHGEAPTDCPMMNESTVRMNPKAPEAPKATKERNTTVVVKE